MLEGKGISTIWPLSFWSSQSPKEKLTIKVSSMFYLFCVTVNQRLWMTQEGTFQLAWGVAKVTADPTSRQLDRKCPQGSVVKTWKYCRWEIIKSGWTEQRHSGTFCRDPVWEPDWQSVGRWGTRQHSSVWHLVTIYHTWVAVRHTDLWYAACIAIEGDLIQLLLFPNRDSQYLLLLPQNMRENAPTSYTFKPTCLAELKWHLHSKPTPRSPWNLISLVPLRHNHLGFPSSHSTCNITGVKMKCQSFLTLSQKARRDSWDDAFLRL
jgi:hypothetical protein